MIYMYLPNLGEFGEERTRSWRRPSTFIHGADLSEAIIGGLQDPPEAAAAAASPAALALATAAAAARRTHQSTSERARTQSQTVLLAAHGLVS